MVQCNVIVVVLYNYYMNLWWKSIKEFGGKHVRFSLDQVTVRNYKLTMFSEPLLLRIQQSISKSVFYWFYRADGLGRTMKSKNGWILCLNFVEMNVRKKVQLFSFFILDTEYISWASVEKIIDNIYVFKFFLATSLHSIWNTMISTVRIQT